MAQQPVSGPPKCSSRRYTRVSAQKSSVQLSWIMSIPRCSGRLNEDVNELRWYVIPLLASPQGGVAASSRKCCEAAEADAAGVVFLCVLNRKTTPASRSADASRHFINRSATPPCGDARRGIRSIPLRSHLRGTAPRIVLQHYRLTFFSTIGAA